MTADQRIGLFGKGRLGSAIAARLGSQLVGSQLVWHVTREAPPAAHVDVAIEVSSGSVVADRLAWALRTGTPLVVGSTGFELDLPALVKDRIGVLVAPNFSLGVALLRRLTRVLARFAALDPTRDPYLVEHHQQKKHDAPSGTAKLLAKAVLDDCPRKRSFRIGGPLEPHELSVGVVRAGSTYSEHRVGIDAPAEVLELSHTARSAAAFVDGALAAARWIVHRKGVHTMDDVAATTLDPLFAGLDGKRT